MEKEEIMMPEMAAPEDAGRGGDSVMAHMSLGEVVIPRAFMDDPETAQVINAIFQSFQTNIREFTVGDEANKINPETGYPEFGWFKKIFKKLGPILSIVAPLLLGPAGLGLSGLGLAAGSAAAGAGIGALGGGKGAFKNALLGGVTGGLAGGGSSFLSKAAGLTGAGAKAASGALTGLSGGYQQGGDLKSALTGAALGGGAGYLSGGGFGTTATAPLGAGVSGPVRPDSGILGSINKATSGLIGKGISGAGLGNISSLGSSNNLSSILGGANSYRTQNDIEEKLLAAQGKAEAAYSPYAQAGAQATGQLSDRLTGGFNPGDLTQDPGYQFRLAEGEKSRNRALSAAGSRESGAAIKAAEEYGQGLADQTYNDAYSRWLQQNSQLAGVSGQGLGAAGAQAGVYDNVGQIKGAGALGRTSTVNKTLAELLTGQSQQTDAYGNASPNQSIPAGYELDANGNLVRKRYG